MAVKVRYYAAARDLCGCAEESFGTPPQGPLSQEALLRAISEKHPSFSDHGARMRLALNGDFIKPTAVIRDGDEVVIMPPMAGGRSEPLVAVRRANLSLDECMEAVRYPGAGGICVFTGVVRDNSQGKAVKQLDYEAYEELAVKEMRRIIDRTMIEMPGALVAATHRIGHLEVGDVAVVVAASAPHRAEAFQACRNTIDRIKETVPIWKKEWTQDGGADWVNLSV